MKTKELRNQLKIIIDNKNKSKLIEIKDDIQKTGCKNNRKFNKRIIHNMNLFGYKTGKTISNFIRTVTKYSLTTQAIRVMKKFLPDCYQNIVLEININNLFENKRIFFYNKKLVFIITNAFDEYMTNNYKSIDCENFNNGLLSNFRKYIKEFCSNVNLIETLDKKYNQKYFDRAYFFVQAIDVYYFNPTKEEIKIRKMLDERIPIKINAPCNRYRIYKILHDVYSRKEIGIMLDKREIGDTFL